MIVETGVHTLVVPQASLSKALSARSAASINYPLAKTLKIEGAQVIEDLLHLVFPQHVKRSAPLGRHIS